MEATPSKFLGFRPSKELEDKIIALAESKGKNIADTIRDLLESATRGEDPNRYAWLEKSCPALVHLNEGFYCAIHAPTAKALGDASNEDAKKVCKACQEIKGIIDKAAQTDKLLKAGYTVEVPYCMGKGIVRENLKTVWCPKIGNERPIEICEKAGINGKRCEYFRLIKADARLKTSRN